MKFRATKNDDDGHSDDVDGTCVHFSPDKGVCALLKKKVGQCYFPWGERVAVRTLSRGPIRNILFRLKRSHFPLKIISE